MFSSWRKMLQFQKELSCNGLFFPGKVFSLSSQNRIWHQWSFCDSLKRILWGSVAKHCSLGRFRVLETFLRHFFRAKTEAKTFYNRNWVITSLNIPPLSTPEQWKPKWIHIKLNSPILGTKKSEIWEEARTEKREALTKFFGWKEVKIRLLGLKNLGKYEQGVLGFSSSWKERIKHNEL